MFHRQEIAVNKTTGVPIPDVIVRLYDANGAPVPIYSDANATPIVTVSDIANAAVADDAGNYSYYVENGVYTERLYIGDALAFSIPNLVCQGLVTTIQTPTFAGASSITSSADTNLVIVSGTDDVGDAGTGRTFAYDEAVDDAYVASNPDTSFVDGTGRGFREIPGSSAVSLSDRLASTDPGKGAALIGVEAGGSVQDAIKGILHLEMFGAVGDSATDDSAALASAIAYQLANGGEIHGTPGRTYLLNTWTTHEPDSVVTIRGNGATFKGPASATDFASPTAAVDIEGVTFDRWASVVKRLAADGGTLDGLRLHGNTFVNCTANPVNVEVQCLGYSIRENRFSLNTGGYNIRIGHSVYADQDNWSGVIDGNHFETISATGSASLAAIIAYGRDTVICNNRINGVAQTGTGEAWGIYTKLRRSKIYANEVYNVTAAGNADNVGINLKGGPRGETLGPNGYSTQAWGNTVRRIGVAGAQGVGIRLQSEDQRVWGNIIEDFGTSGITVDETNSGVKRNTVLGNSIIGTGTSGEVGIRLACTGHSVMAVDNQIADCEVSIRCGGIGDQNDFIVSGNQIDCPTGLATTYGILIGNSTNNITSLVIEDNKLRSNFTHAIRNENTGTSSKWRVRRNTFDAPTNKMSGTWPTMFGEDVITLEAFPNASHTGDTAETSVATATIPGGTIGKNGVVEILPQWEFTGTAGTKTTREKFGGTTYRSEAAGATVLSSSPATRIVNLGSESAQKGTPSNISVPGNSTLVLANSSVNTANDVTIDFTVALGNAADTATLVSYLIRIHPKFF